MFMLEHVTLISCGMQQLERAQRSKNLKKFARRCIPTRLDSVNARNPTVLPVGQNMVATLPWLTLHSTM